MRARSITFRNFDTFRTSGTDLYISLNRLMGKDQKYTNDKDDYCEETNFA